jgi:hypothetical protein
MSQNPPPPPSPDAPPPAVTNNAVTLSRFAHPSPLSPALPERSGVKNLFRDGAEKRSSTYHRWDFHHQRRMEGVLLVVAPRSALTILMNSMRTNPTAMPRMVTTLPLPHIRLIVRQCSNLAGNVADMSVGDDTTCRSNFGQMGPCRRHKIEFVVAVCVGLSRHLPDFPKCVCRK